MAILVTGGAGYIGSVTAADLLAHGRKVVVLDNLSRGHRGAVPSGAEFIQGHVGDVDLVADILSEHKIDGCIHFAAFAYVGESVQNPELYFENNIAQTERLLKVLVSHDVRRFIFSSTCATYGEPQYLPLDEDHPQHPVNPYGQTKFEIEQRLKELDAAGTMRHVALRYFNASGATEFHGEHHDPETHLIPLIIKVAQGLLSHVQIFGNDYPTKDGTAVRDYIHVSDLSRAHLLALDYLEHGGASECINLGNGSGFSVREVIDAVERVAGVQIASVETERRAGDPSELIADASRARTILGWSPVISDIEQIIESAWRWHVDHPSGYSQSE